jgi:hypothetical protein
MYGTWKSRLPLCVFMFVISMGCMEYEYQFREEGFYHQSKKQNLKFIDSLSLFSSFNVV